MEQPKQIKCYCGHTTYCDCSPLEHPKQFSMDAELYENNGIVFPKLPKQEIILEEAAKVIYPDNGYKDELYCDLGEYNRDLFIEGAKWQQEPQQFFNDDRVKTLEKSIEYLLKRQERMYSEEDMKQFAEFVASYPDKNRNHKGEILHAKSKYDGSERTIDLLQIWFKQLKNKL